jgi:hypothetical protein
MTTDPAPAAGDPDELAGSRIVVGVDDSEQAAAALRWALTEGAVVPEGSIGEVRVLERDRLRAAGGGDDVLAGVARVGEAIATIANRSFAAGEGALTV